MIDLRRWCTGSTADSNPARTEFDSQAACKLVKL